MGNFISSNSKNPEAEFNNFYEVVDYIATYYILTMDFKSLSKLSEKVYCDKLVILTSDIIERYFNEREVTFLAQRIKNGVEVNELKKENVSFINKDNLEGLDISNDAQKSIRKKRVCIGIAKFYVKVAHIFAAIVMTINPVYTYKDPTGQTIKTGLLEKDKIPKNTKRKLYKLNICDNRIRALKKGESLDNVTGNVTIQPKICNMNINADGTVKDLKDEPGIPELMNLYLDDNYDYSNGTFSGMSDKTKGQFMKDLQTFYTAFTENNVMPPEITKFSDIKLRDYRNKPGCQGSVPVLKSKLTLNAKDKLFVQYADNIKQMIQSAADNQYKLLDVINELFTYVIDPYSGKKVIRINPKLNDETLQNSVIKTRKLIVNLYVKCETDYVNGMKIYEAIVESKILDTTQKQIDSLKIQANKFISDTKKTVAPVNTTPVPVTVPVTVPVPVPVPVPVSSPVSSPVPVSSPESTSSVEILPIKQVSTLTATTTPMSSSSKTVFPIKQVPTISQTNSNSLMSTPTTVSTTAPSTVSTSPSTTVSTTTFSSAPPTTTFTSAPSTTVSTTAPSTVFNIPPAPVSEPISLSQTMSAPNLQPLTNTTVSSETTRVV